MERIARTVCRMELGPVDSISCQILGYDRMQAAHAPFMDFREHSPRDDWIGRPGAGDRSRSARSVDFYFAISSSGRAIGNHRFPRCDRLVTQRAAPWAGASRQRVAARGVADAAIHAARNRRIPAAIRTSRSRLGTRIPAAVAGSQRLNPFGLSDCTAPKVVQQREELLSLPQEHEKYESLG